MKQTNFPPSSSPLLTTHLCSAQLALLSPISRSKLSTAQALLLPWDSKVQTELPHASPCRSPPCCFWLPWHCATGAVALHCCDTRSPTSQGWHILQKTVLLWLAESPRASWSAHGFAVSAILILPRPWWQRVSEPAHSRHLIPRHRDPSVTGLSCAHSHMQKA